MINLEIFSRFYKPVFPGIRIFSVINDKEIPTFNTPNSKYYQRSTEFDVITTIDSRGYRIVPSSNNYSKNYLVFLGDSFTFGQAVSDYENIPNIVCKKYEQANCVNLGVPGSSADSQLKLLESFVNSEPNLKGHLFHLIFASTSQNHAGNDLSVYPKSKDLEKEDLQIKSSSFFTLLRSWIRELSKKSNLFRVIRLYAGDKIRLLAYTKSTSEISKFQISQFTTDIQKIATMSNNSGLLYVPVLVSSSSSIAKGDHFKTHARLEKEIGIKILLPKSNWDIRKDFFPLDGHATFEGNKKFSQVIIDYLD